MNACSRLEGVDGSREHRVERLKALGCEARDQQVLASRWLEQPPGFGRHLILSPATLSILAHEREAPALETWNAPVL